MAVPKRKVSKQRGNKRFASNYKATMPTLVECKDAAECISLAKRLSLSFVELNQSFPQYQSARIDADALKKSGIGFTFHADETAATRLVAQQVAAVAGGDERGHALHLLHLSAMRALQRDGGQLHQVLQCGHAQG